MTGIVNCPACAGECPDGSRFCLHCGAPLAAPAPHAVERKVVTTMFCDLVDFTGFCESVDPEEADRVLRQFYALARRAIETYGGVVEKFVGDAVVGIFGVPTVHEDDPERAVLTAIRLLDQIPALPPPADRALEVRVGINTGTAVVRLDVVPGSGEGFLVGDAVNTAARLQRLAPPMGIVVGEKTQALTTRRISYEALEPAALKGKRSAVGCWRVRGPISRMGIDLRRQFPAPLVDREVEFGILRGLLKKVRASSQPQFAVVVGEAGIGKSRLLFEFASYIDRRPFIVRWRQGRCPAYGDGLTFWSLSEIVKEQLGVAEVDSLATIETKLARALSGEDDREWLAARLRPLLGLESPAATREENFAAWQRFLEIVAADSPAVVVFEDLQWASEATLAFLGHLVRHGAGVPLLVVGTARPDLLRARPDLDSRLAGIVSTGRIVRIDLEPLSDSETQKLVAQVGRGLGDVRETQQAIVRRAAGNPLYAEQLVRLLEGEPAAGQAAADVALEERVARALPDSLQSLIAARLDDLPPDRKALLADAAVVGEVFWSGAVAALDHGDRAAAEQGLEDLVQRDLVRHERESSVVGESEFAFRHGLIRDVAYAQLTRTDRAAKHAAVARWVEATAGDRVDELAEILAHHYATALELGGSTFADGSPGELLEPTLRALQLAGDRALPLDVAAAERHFARAAGLAPHDAAQRPSIFVSWADALAQGGDLSRAADLLEEGIDGLRAAGDNRRAALAMTRLGGVLFDMNDPRSGDLAEEARSLLENDDPSPEKIRVMADVASDLAIRYKGRAAIAAADQALAACSRLGLPDSARALAWRGMARCDLGDEGGLDDLQRGLELAGGQGLWREAGVMFYLLSLEVRDFRGPRAAMDVQHEGMEFVRGRGDENTQGLLRAAIIEELAAVGEWDEVISRAEHLESQLERRGILGDLAGVRNLRARILALRGRPDEAARVIAWCRAQNFVEPTVAMDVLGSLAAIQLAAGQDDQALLSLAELAGVRRRLESHPHVGMALPAAVMTAIAAGDLGLASELTEGAPLERSVDAHTDAMLKAAFLEDGGEFDTAAEAFAAAAARWRGFGTPYEEAQALVGRGRCLTALQRTAEARLALTQARDLFARLKARPALATVESLLRGLEQSPATPAGQD